MIRLSHTGTYALHSSCLQQGADLPAHLMQIINILESQLNSYQVCRNAELRKWPTNDLHTAACRWTRMIFKGKSSFANFGADALILLILAFNIVLEPKSKFHSLSVYNIQAWTYLIVPIYHKSYQVLSSNFFLFSIYMCVHCRGLNNEYLQYWQGIVWWIKFGIIPQFKFCIQNCQ